MLNEFDEKVKDLRRRFREIESAVVAFSGGVDSAVLIATGHEELGDRMLAATADSPSLPDCDRRIVEKFCRQRGIPHRFVRTREFDDPQFVANPDERCYHCKRHLYGRLVSLADERGMLYVVEGTNASDLAGHRPGYRASRENDRVVTLLVDCGFTKDDVRKLARSLGLPQAEKPSAACLSSRVPTGQELNVDLLQRIDRAEDALREIGAGQVRVRHHGDIARIEVDPEDMTLCLEKRSEINSKIRDLGWKFVTIDLAGYRI